jgi:hypothetical protein
MVTGAGGVTTRIRPESHNGRRLSGRRVSAADSAGSDHPEGRQRRVGAAERINPVLGAGHRHAIRLGVKDAIGRSSTNCRVKSRPAWWWLRPLRVAAT